MRPMKQDVKGRKTEAVRKIREGEILRIMRRMVLKNETSSLTSDNTFSAATSVASPATSCQQVGAAASVTSDRLKSSTDSVILSRYKNLKKAVDEGDTSPTELDNKTLSIPVKKTTSDLCLRPWTPEVTSNDHLQKETPSADLKFQSGVKLRGNIKNNEPKQKCTSPALLSPTLSFCSSSEIPTATKNLKHTCSTLSLSSIRGGAGSLRKLVEKSRNSPNSSSSKTPRRLVPKISFERMTYGNRLRHALNKNVTQVSKSKVSQLTVSEKTGRAITNLAEEDDFIKMKESLLVNTNLIVSKQQTESTEATRREAITYEGTLSTTTLLKIQTLLKSHYLQHQNCISSENQIRDELFKTEISDWENVATMQVDGFKKAKENFTTRILRENAHVVREKNQLLTVSAPVQNLEKFYNIQRELVCERESQDYKRIEVAVTCFNQKNKLFDINNGSLRIFFTVLNTFVKLFNEEKRERELLIDYNNKQLTIERSNNIDRRALLQDCNHCGRCIVSSEDYLRSEILVYRHESMSRITNQAVFINQRQSEIKTFLINTEHETRLMIKTSELRKPEKVIWGIQLSEIRNRQAILNGYERITSLPLLKTQLSESNHRIQMEQHEIINLEELYRKTLSMACLVSSWAMSIYIKNVNNDICVQKNRDRQYIFYCAESASRQQIFRKQDLKFSLIQKSSDRNIVIIIKLVSAHKTGANMIRHQESSRKLIIINWLQICMEETAYRQHLQKLLFRKHNIGCFQHLRAVKRRGIIQEEVEERRGILIRFSVIGSETSSRKIIEILKENRYAKLRFMENSSKESASRRQLSKSWYSESISVLLRWMFDGDNLTLSNQEVVARGQVFHGEYAAFCEIRKQYTTSFIIANSDTETCYRSNILQEEMSCRVTLHILQRRRSEYLLRNWIERHEKSARMRFPRIGIFSPQLGVAITDKQGPVHPLVAPFPFVDPTALSYGDRLQHPHHSFWGVGGAPQTL